jgi:competence protein ComEC
MLTGDSPESIEAYLVELYGDSLESEVLKAGHHGSRTSSSEGFVNVVGPATAIISAGKDNRYGHPHKDVLELFTRLGIETKNTADEGSISCVINGLTAVCD